MSEAITSEPLGQNINVLSGFAFPSAGFNQLVGLPLIRIRDLGGAQTEVRFSGQYDPAYLIQNGDILIGMDGDFEVHRWSGDVALLNQRVCKVEAATRQVDQPFLYWYLKPRVAEVHRRTPQTTVRHLSARDLYLIPMPPIPALEQVVVAQVLDTLDTAIHETEAIIAKLKAVKQGLLHDLLTRGIDANGELRPPQSEAPHLYKPSPLGWIPKEWEAWPLAKSIQLVSGQHIPSELCNIVGKGVPYFTGPSDFLGASTVVTQYTNYPQIMCDAGDILITVKGSGCGKVAVASVRACISRQLMAIKVPHSTLQYWLAVFQNQQELLNRLATGGNIPGISRTQILNLTLPTPRSANEMSEIGDRICALDSQLVAEQQFLEKLRLQRAGLMDDLLTGRVRVTPLLQEAQYA